MSVVYIVFPLALLIAAAAVAAFVWAARTGQFDDLDTPPLRILGDDEPDARKTGKPASAAESGNDGAGRIRSGGEPPPAPRPDRKA